MVQHYTYHPKRSQLDLRYTRYIQRMRILIIEDDVKIANAVKKGLEQESYAVDVAYDAPTGYGSARADDYDLIILDRMLPGISDGLELCRQLREAGKTMPVLMLTAKDTIDQRVEGLNGGADDYLIKPFAFDELVARIRALLRRPQNHIDSSIEVSDLVLNTQSFIATRQGKEIALSTKEFALLEYLMRNKNRVLTKDAIIAHVWDFDADVLPNTVEVYIGYLRRKIDEPFKKSPAIIKTVRGFGYTISDQP